MSSSETARTLFFEALDCIDASDFAGAESRLREALRHAPGNLQVLTNLSMVLSAQGKHGEARGFAGEALAARPDNIEALLVLADCCTQAGDRQQALATCDRIIALDPAIAEVHVNRGNALGELRRHDEALAAYDRGIALSPGMADAWLGRGNTLSMLKRGVEAIDAFQRALSLNPDMAEAWLGRGNVLHDLGRHDEALAAFDKALALAPDLAEALLGRGNVLHMLQRNDEALAAYDRALQSKPDLSQAAVGRGTALRLLGRTQEAIAAYREALRVGGESGSINYYLAALGAAAAPAAPPENFVANLFDMYADTFDRDLVGKLKYETPIHLAHAIGRYVSSRGLDILDMGCGTGLMGEHLRPLARTLTGIDLSPNMLEKARQRNVYDRLVADDLVHFLQTNEQAFDLAVAADVFVYLGDLSPVFAAARRALRDGGVFGFSVEASEEGEMVLRKTLRYAHSQDYLRTLADRHRFAVATIEAQVIRQEAGTGINGYLAVMRCL